MKKSLILAAASVITASLLFSCSYHRRHHNNSLNVSVSASGNIYKLKAEYNEEKTADVQSYINSQVAPNGLFASPEDYFDANTELKDGTRFYIKSSPGRLLIKINRQENSYASYTRIKNMCEGITNLLKDPSGGSSFH